MKTNLLFLFLLVACSIPSPNPILQPETKLEKEIPYHFNYETIPSDCAQRDSLLALLYQKDQEVKHQKDEVEKSVFYTL